MRHSWNPKWGERVSNEKNLIYRNEAFFLAAMLAAGDPDNQEDQWNTLVFQMTEEYFFTQEGKLIWRKMQKLRKEGIYTDEYTLPAEFISENGGIIPNDLYLAIRPLFDELKSHTKNANHWAKLMLADYFTVQLQKAIKEVGESGNGIDRVIKLQLILDNLRKEHAQGFQAQKIYSMNDGLQELTEILEDRYKNKNIKHGISTGYYSLDSKINFGPGHLVIIGGRASVGKTTAAMNMIANMILNNKKIVFFSLEMSRAEILQNFVAMTSSVDYSAMSNGQMEEEEFDRIYEANRQLSEKYCTIYDEGNQSIEQMIPKIHSAAIKMNGIDAIFIDHMHIIRGEGKKTMRENMVDISARLKALAKEWSVPVIALAQMNRDADKRVDKRPIMSDLKESGSIEQDADSILFIYRDSLYQNEDNTSKSNPYAQAVSSMQQKSSPYTEIICRKNRHGVLPFFTVEMKVDGKTKKMTERYLKENLEEY